jgi:beta-1,4-mannosyltransferase
MDNHLDEHSSTSTSANQTQTRRIRDFTIAQKPRPGRLNRILAWPGISEKAINPYTWLIYRAMQQDGVEILEFSPYSLGISNCDVFHIHWPERLFWGRPSRLHPLVSRLLSNRVISAAKQVKRRGGIVVWTAHNLQPHGGFAPERRAVWDDYFTRLRAQIDLVINMSESAKALLLAAYPDLSSRAMVTIPHPHYGGMYPSAIAKPAARQPLGIPDDAIVLCSLGGIRPNKGTAEMIEAFVSCAHDDEYLIVGGQCNNQNYLDRLRELVGDSNNVRVIDRFLSDRQVSDIMSAADACMMNFQSILNSGSVLLGLSFGKPVITPFHGSIGELAHHVGRNWLLPLARPLTPTSLRAIIDELRQRNSTNPLSLDAFEPAIVSEMTRNAYETALDSRNTRQRR